MFGCSVWDHFWDGKFEPRIRKCEFLVYASGGYMLWCNDEKSPGIIINRDVKFNEFASLNNRHREDAVIKLDCSTKEQVKVEVDAVIQSNNSSRHEM